MSPDVLPPHHDHCYVCGPASGASTGVRFRRVDRCIVGQVVLDDRHQGVPGLAHGGAVAALMDEAAGTVLIQRGLRFVTARLDVTYVAPVPIGRDLEVRAEPIGRDGRKLTVEAVLADGDLTLATATALFVSVPQEHFSSRGLDAGALSLFGV